MSPAHEAAAGEPAERMPQSEPTGVAEDLAPDPSPDEPDLGLEELESEISRAEELHGELSRRLDAAGRD